MTVSQLVTKLDERWTLQGKLGTLLAFSMIASISSDFRIPIGGLLVHLYLLLMIPAIVIGRITIWNVSSNILAPLSILVATFTVSLAREADVGEIVKIVSGVITFLFFLKVIKSEKDYTYISLGFIALSLVVSINTFFAAQESFSLAGVNSLSGIGNKNAQSLYTLPGLFFLCYLLNRVIEEKKLIFLVFWLVAFLMILAGIAYTGNRSGYVGAAVILIMTVFQNFRSNFGGLLVILFAIWIGIQFINNAGEENQIVSMLDHKWTQTTGGYQSDNYRQKLLLTSLSLGVSNPILGLGSAGLQAALADKVVGGSFSYLDPHNVYGYIFGSSGAFAFIAFILFFYNLIGMSLRQARFIGVIKRQKPQIAFWCMAFITLYLLRGLFTREILYSPTMMGGLGLIFGLLANKYKMARLQLLRKTIS